MDLQNIQEQLNAEFAKQDTRIIFWFDDKGDYENEVAEIELNNANLHILDGSNWLYSKWLLYEADPEGKYLVYAPFSRPKDFLSVVGEESTQAVLESELVPQIVSSVAEMVTTEGVSLVLGSVIGAVAPRINGIRIGILEKRFEQRVESALAIMQSKIQLLESNYELLNEDMQEKFRGLYVEWLMDSLYSERQPEKVESHINGYINMILHLTI